jgi:carboxyl-terminal processing protease
MSILSWRSPSRSILLTAACLGVALFGPLHSARAQDAAATATPTANTSVASVDQLETQAVDAIHQGQFEKFSTLFNQAADVANDSNVKHLAALAADFESQEKTVAAERHKEFEKDVKDVHILLDNNFRGYALDALREAYLRADDKDAFRKETWVDDLVNANIADAKTAEAAGQWLTALRIYSDLTSLDPYDPTWKDKLKVATQRIRLLLVYTPDQFKAIQDSEAGAREKADALLSPTTQPTTAPSVTDDVGDFKLDWHETVHGITFDMLLDSIIYAERDYYRDVTLQGLLNGGIDSLRTLATTKGLDKAFPGLGNETRLKDFLWDLDQASDKVKTITPDNEDDMVHSILTQLLQDDQTTVNLPQEVFTSEFADGALSGLDPFSSMIWPYDVDEFKQTTQGEFSGVGIEIESAKDGSLKVVSPLEDSPAYKSGIKAGDTITYIDGKNAHGISPTQAVKSITGPPHTDVVLTIRSVNGASRNHTIERQTINVVSVKGYIHLPGGGWDYFIDPDSKIAYIRLTNFTAKSDDEITAAMGELQRQGARALILDLRANPGGLLSAAVEIASKFIRSGVIVSTHPDRPTENPPTVAEAEHDDQTTDMPLAVLVNQYSASASEIVSGALKDHHRATIIGERTFGKGSVQMLFPLAAKTAYLKLTTSHYYLPSGRCLHREENSTVWGVDPDVTVPLTPEQMEGAIEARRDMEVLHDAATKASPDAAADAPTTQPDDASAELLKADPQLSAALLVLRMKLAGVQI